MYVIRSALRVSTKRPPARFIRGRRYPSTPRLRPLHTTRTLAQAANPPPAPNGTPADQDDVSKTDREKAAAVDEPAEGAVASEDPEALSKKLQQSRETSRRYSAALRRQQRGKKTQGLPPVHIPDWFLKKRVLRHEQYLADPQVANAPTVISLAVAHNESGEHAACTIPTSPDSDATQMLSRLVRGLWNRRLVDYEKRKVHKYLEERTALADQAETDQSQVGSDEAVASTEAGRPGEVPTATITEGNAMEVLDAKIEAMRKQSAKLSGAAKKRELAKARQMGSPRRLSSLVIAEIRATMAASLYALQPLAGDSFPAAKTNISLHSPTAEHELLIDECVTSTALEMGADVVVLKAQDLASLAGDYLGEGAEPSSRSIRSLGYETYRINTDLGDLVRSIEDSIAQDESDWSQPSSTDQSDSNPVRPRAIPLSIISLKDSLTPALRAMTQSLNLKDVRLSAADFGTSSDATADESGRSQTPADVQLEDMKLAALLDAIIDSGDLKQSRGFVDSAASTQSSEQSQTSSKARAFFDYSLPQEGAELELNTALPINARADINMTVKVGSAARTLNAPTKSKVIYVKDYKQLNATHYGGRIIQKLEELVRRRRSVGESVMIVGSTTSRDLTPELSPIGVRALQSEGENGFFRTIVVAADPISSITPDIDEVMASLGSKTTPSADISTAEKDKFRRINLWHIQDMLRSLDPAAAAEISNLEQSPSRFAEWAPMFHESQFDRVLTYDEVHRVALTALGLLITRPPSDAAASGGVPGQVSWAHVALAMGLLKASDTMKFAVFDLAAAAASKRSKNVFSNLDGEMPADLGKKRQDEKSMQRQRNLQRIASTASKHEKRLMPGIADPDQIKTTFEQVHVPTETVDSIRTITSLSLLRPEAFSYGILATEKISGALLYGPPGTGKTLLAKAVAKESGSTVLEVSGSQIMDKYVGEGEKNVAAIFSLARKLSPCIVFLDEADAVFASRDAMRERTSHRDILNQFLKEWDGLNDLSVFVMVATNRPFDLDDAVIRRLPRRLLVDLPTQADRKEILRIHLKGEQLDDSVDLADIAKRTPFYSGSDLKNMAVSAALACVKEENEHAAIAAAMATEESESTSSSDSSEPPSDSPTTSTSTSTSTSSTSPPTEQSSPTPPPPKAPHLVRGQNYTFPEKRTLHSRHFDKALQEISASISEDMSSLSAIKKFDEQYGDRKGNKRRKDFGFGVVGERNESAARVRI